MKRLRTKSNANQLPHNGHLGAGSGPRPTNRFDAFCAALISISLTVGLSAPRLD